MYCVASPMQKIGYTLRKSDYISLSVPPFFERLLPLNERLPKAKKINERRPIKTAPPKSSQTEKKIDPCNRFPILLIYIRFSFYFFFI